MKQLIICIILIPVLLFASCSAGNETTERDEQTSLAGRITTEAEPTGGTDGLPDSTYVYYNGVLYVRDWSRFCGLEEGDGDRDARFNSYSRKHFLKLLGIIEKNDNSNLPSENLVSYNASVGDTLYEDENGDLFLLIAESDLLWALKADEEEFAERKDVQPHSDGAITTEADPAGSPESLPDGTYIFCNGVLYVWEWPSYEDLEEKDKAVDNLFDEYSRNHFLKLLGEIQINDDHRLPEENFVSYNAEVGDRLYEDENGNILLLRSYDNRLRVLKVSE